MSVRNAAISLLSHGKSVILRRGSGISGSPTTTLVLSRSGRVRYSIANPGGVFHPLLRPSKKQQRQAARQRRAFVEQQHNVYRRVHSTRKDV